MKACAAVTGMARLVQFAVLCLAPVALAQNETNRGAPLSGSRVLNNNLRDEARPIVTPPAEAQVQANLSPWTAEIVRLTEAGIGEDVIFSFIENSGTFSLGADEVIHLTTVGVHPEIIRAMLEHDYELVSGQRQETITTTPPVSPALLAFLDARDAAKKSAPSIVAAAVGPTASSDSIIATRPAEDWMPVEPEPEETSVGEGSDQKAKATPERYPVRKPYPVQLTMPIVMYRSAAARIPNVVTIEFGP
jgi:hypothetical protein